MDPSVDAVVQQRMRKLRPVYDALDARQYRKALKLCDKRDITNLALTNALRAIAYVNLGDHSTASGLVSSVLSTNPSDPGLCATVASALQSMDQDARVATMYQSAVNRNPTSTELLEELLFACVRVSKWRDAQQAAMKLWKASSSAKYMAWAALCAVSGPDTAQTAAKLAAAMSLRALDAGFATEEALCLHLHTLCLQNEFAAALAVVKFRGEASLQPIDVLKHTGALHIRLGEWLPAYHTFVQLLQCHDFDDWSFHQSLVACLLRVHEDAVTSAAGLGGVSAVPVDVPTDAAPLAPTDTPTVASTLRLFRQLQSRAKAAGAGRAPQRGPFLAEILLECSVLQASSCGVSCGGPVDAADPTRHLTALITAYFAAYGDRATAVHDLLPFLLPYAPAAVLPVVASASDGVFPPMPATDTPFAPLPPATLFKGFTFRATDASRAAVVGALDAVPAAGFPDVEPPAAPEGAMGAVGAVGAGAGAGAGSESRPVSASNSQVQRLACAYHLLWFLRGDRLTADAPTAVRELVAAWRSAVPFVPLRDEFLVLATHILRHAASQSLADTDADHTLAWQALVEAAALLEAARVASPDNPQLKLGLVRVYAWLGAGSSLVQAWDSLHAMHIQMDTLVHVLLAPLLNTGQLETAGALCDRAATLQRSTHTNVRLYSREALSNGHFSKVWEFGRLMRRVDASVYGVYTRSVLAFSQLSCRSFGELCSQLEDKLVTQSNPYGSVSIGQDFSALRDNSDYAAEARTDAEGVVGAAAVNRTSTSTLPQRVLRLRHSFMTDLYKLTAHSGGKGVELALTVDTLAALGLTGRHVGSGSDTATGVDADAASPPPPPGAGAGVGAGAGAGADGSGTASLQRVSGPCLLSNASSTAPEAFGNGLCCSRPQVLRLITLQAGAAVLTGDPASHSNAAALLTQAASRVTAVCDAVRAGKAVGGVADADTATDIHPRFLSESAAVCSDLLLCVGVVAAVALKLLPAAPKARGGKKGKKGKAGGGGGGGGGASPTGTAAATVRTAVKQLVAASSKAATELCSALSERVGGGRGKEPDCSKLAGFRGDACWAAAVDSGDAFVKARGVVVKEVRGSWAECMEDVKRVGKDRNALLLTLSRR